jgi:hypothetical protein
VSFQVAGADRDGVDYDDDDASDDDYDEEDDGDNAEEDEGNHSLATWRHRSHTRPHLLMLS